MIPDIQEMRSSVADDLRDIFRPTAAPVRSTVEPDAIFAMHRPPPRPRPSRKLPVLVTTLGVTSATAVAWLLTPTSLPLSATPNGNIAPPTLAIASEPEGPIRLSSARTPLDLRERTLTAAVATAAVPAARVIEPETVSEPRLAMADQSIAASAGSVCANTDASDLGWCMQPAVLEADSRLREAYAVAIDAGVDRKMLIDYRSDWSRLRRKAPKDPRRVIEGYERMASELHAEAQQQRRTRRA